MWHRFHRIGLGVLLVGLTVPPAAHAQIPDKAVIYKGGMSFGGGFSMDVELSWNHKTGHLLSRGRITGLGRTLAVSEADGQFVNGKILQIHKTWKGASGLRADTTLRLHPGPGAKVRWTFNYKIKNSHAPFVHPVTGSKSGTIRVAKAPWDKVKKKKLKRATMSQHSLANELAVGRLISDGTPSRRLLPAAFPLCAPGISADVVTAPVPTPIPDRRCSALIF